MELRKDERPLLARFTASRDVVLVSPAGDRCQRFEAGETQNVHRSLFEVAIREGLVPEDPLEVKEEPKAAPRKSQEDEVSEGLLDAVKTLIVRGNPADFTMAGKPRAASVKKLVDFNFTTRDVDRAFEQAMHEVEQDGNDSTEHSEPSSSAAE